MATRHSISAICGADVRYTAEFTRMKQRSYEQKEVCTVKTIYPK